MNPITMNPIENISFYYLFGKDAVELYNDYIGTAEGFSKLLREEFTTFATFKFEYGVTSPSQLLHAYQGWDDYRSIPVEFYEALQTNPNLVTL